MKSAVMPEIWDVLDENGRPTGKTALRGDGILEPGEYHLVVHVWVASTSGKLLIQRRAEDRKLMPGEWAATGGSAVAGEDSETAARRELYEELGIAARDMRFLTRIKRRNSLLDVWLTVDDTPSERLVLQSTEVAEAKWVTECELKRMIEGGGFHNYGSEYFKTVFAQINDYRGNIL